VPKVQVTFSIDANGILSVEARDLGTGRSQAVSVTATSGLNQTEVDALVQEGERFKETDQLRRDLAEMRNQAETLIYTTEQALEGYADLLSPEKLASVEQEVHVLKKMLETGANLDAMRAAYSTLENATFEIAEAMYATPEVEPGA
jgi:molecular chaperone DnaK